MSRHHTLRATWAPGQIWDTRNDECAHDDAAWVPVGDAGRAQPVWDEHQEYRRREDLERLAAAAADPATIGREGLLRAQARNAAGESDQHAECAAEIHRLQEVLAAIGDYAHDRSAGPAVRDALWEVRRMAYDAIRADGAKGTSNDQGEKR